MIIYSKRDKRQYKVYSISWNSNGFRSYFVIPDKYPGVIVMDEIETEIIDPTIDEKFILRKNDYGGDMFLHWALDKDNLVYGLIEHDPEAISEFKKRIGVE